MQKEVDKALQVLKAGGLILYPTDTIWGIGCDATHAAAVDKIYRIKKRDPEKSMLVLVSDLRMVEQYLAHIPEVALQLFDISEDPLTLILDHAVRLADNLPAQDGSIGMRIPNDDFCQHLVRRLNKPLVSTSANFSGEPMAASFADISQELIEQVDYVVNWRQNDPPSAKASSVIRIKENGEIEILRK